MTGHSLSFLMGPLVASGALGVIVLIMRWVFAPPPPRPQPVPASRRDFGLLVPVATAGTRDRAELARATLRDAGIRCTVTQGEGELLVLVFAADAARASELVRG